MKKLLIFLGVAVIFAGCSAFAPDDAAKVSTAGKIHGHADITKGEIAPAALYDKLQRGEKFVLLDVREADEYEEVHIPETTHRISVKEISEDAFLKAGIKKDDEIIVYCRSGARSRVAATKMREMGFKNVWEVNSGIIHWLEDGFPSESGAESETLKTLSRDEIVGAQPAVGPQIAFDRETHDFGDVKQLGGKVSTTFSVRNSGSADLLIDTITTSCSCTEAKLDSAIIKAGQSATLTVTFNPNLHEEPVEKFKRTIFIPSNDSQKPEAELSIFVDILEGE